TTLLRENAQPVHIAATFVGQGFFDVFGLPMTLGRDFSRDEQAPNAQPGQGPPPVTVIAYHAWMDLFGGDPQIVGKTVRFTEFGSQVIGVAARDLDMPQGTDFWMNARFGAEDVGHGLAAVIRVKPGTTLERLRGELAAVMVGLGRDYPVAEAG